MCWMIQRAHTQTEKVYPTFFYSHWKNNKIHPTRIVVFFPSNFQRQKWNTKFLIVEKNLPSATSCQCGWTGVLFLTVLYSANLKLRLNSVPLFLNKCLPKFCVTKLFIDFKNLYRTRVHSNDARRHVGIRMRVWYWTGRYLRVCTYTNTIHIE